jgi:hypothetical protein
MDQLRDKALKLGASDFGESKLKSKRFYVVYDGKKINFGSAVGKTFYDHQDSKKKDAWIARHSKVLNKEGEKVINLKSSPSFWAAKILWN